MKNDPRTQMKELLKSEQLEELLVRAAALHGHYCPGLAFGIKAGHTGLERLGFENTGMEELLAVVECNNCFVDGIQMSTGCSMGNNSLIYKDIGKTAVTIMSRKTGSAVRLVLKPRSWEGEGATERDREAADLFRRVVKERRDDPEASRRMRELWQELSFETVGKPVDELFTISEAPCEFPEFAPIVDSIECTVCKEEFMCTKNAGTEDKPVCLNCADKGIMAVLGRGITELGENN